MGVAGPVLRGEGRHRLPARRPYAVRTADLRDGKLYFTPAAAKVRKARVAVLPADLFARLRRLAGPTYLWEVYTAEMAKYLTLRKVPTLRISPTFDPRRLNWWAKDEVIDFNAAHPDRPRLQSHDFRKRAITEALAAGRDIDTAAAAVGMTAATARTYDLSLDQERAAATLADKLAATLRPGKGTA